MRFEVKKTFGWLADVNETTARQRSELGLSWLRAMWDNVHAKSADRFGQRRRFRPGRLSPRIVETFPDVAEVGLCMVLPRKNAGARAGSSSRSKLLDAGPLANYAELWAFLTSVTHPDGEKRKTGRLSFSCDAGALVLSLNDPETSQYATLTGDSLKVILDEAELQMNAGELRWRQSKFGK
jgi:hypothetical protein